MTNQQVFLPSGSPFFDYYNDVAGQRLGAQFVTKGTCAYDVLLDWIAGRTVYQGKVTLFECVAAAGAAGIPEPVGPATPEPQSSSPQPPSVLNPPPAPPPATTATVPTAAGGGGAPAPSWSDQRMYGQRLSQENIDLAKIIVRVGGELGATRQVKAAAIYAAMGESRLSYDYGSGGVFQTTCNDSAYEYGHDVALMAHAWYTGSGGPCFPSGGGIAKARQYNSVWQIANSVENNAVWGKSRGDSYSQQENGTYSIGDLTAEAYGIVDTALGEVSTTPVSQTFTPPASPNFSVGGGLEQQIRKLNWAGYLENAFKEMRGGADEAAHMAQTNRNDHSQVTWVGFSQ